MKKKTNLHRSICLLLFLFFTTLICFSQNNFPVTGKILDADGNALSGVTVEVKGTQIRTATKPDGTFQINAPSSKATLIFTYVGYEEQQIDLNDRAEVSLTMKPGA
jgi:hypothetical protein